MKKTIIAIYSMLTKVPCHPLNFRTVAAIFIKVVSKYSKLDIFYRMTPLAASPGGKLRNLLLYLENGTR